MQPVEDHAAHLVAVATVAPTATMNSAIDVPGRIVASSTDVVDMGNQAADAGTEEDMDTLKVQEPPEGVLLIDTGDQAAQAGSDGQNDVDDTRDEAPPPTPPYITIVAPSTMPMAQVLAGQVAAGTRLVPNPDVRPKTAQQEELDKSEDEPDEPAPSDGAESTTPGSKRKRQRKEKEVGQRQRRPKT